MRWNWSTCRRALDLTADSLFFMSLLYFQSKASLPQPLDLFVLEQVPILKAVSKENGFRILAWAWVGALFEREIFILCSSSSSLFLQGTDKHAWWAATAAAGSDGRVVRSFQISSIGGLKKWMCLACLNLVGEFGNNVGLYIIK